MNQRQMENKTEELSKCKTNHLFFIQKSENSEMSVCNSEIYLEGRSKEAFSKESGSSNMGEGGVYSPLGNQSWLKQKRRDETESDSSLSPQERRRFNVGRWTDNEHKKFLEAIMMYGNEWKRVQHYISTRSSTQARSHAQKFFLRLKKSIKVSGGLEERNTEYFSAYGENKKVTAENHKYDSVLKFLTDYSKRGQIEYDRLAFDDSNSLSEEQRQKLINIVLNFTRNCVKTKSCKNEKPHKTKRKIRKESSDDEEQSNYNSQEGSSEEGLNGEDDVKLFNKTNRIQFLEADESIQHMAKSRNGGVKNLIFVITKVKRKNSESNSLLEFEELSYNNKGIMSISSFPSPSNERVTQENIKQEHSFNENGHDQTNNRFLNSLTNSKSLFNRVAPIYNVPSTTSTSSMSNCKPPLPSERNVNLSPIDQSPFNILSESFQTFTNNVPRKESLYENSLYPQDTLQHTFSKVDFISFNLSKFSDPLKDKKNLFDELKCFFGDKRKNSENKSFTREDSRCSSRRESKICNFANQEEIFSDKNLIPEKRIIESEENSINPFFIHFDIESCSTPNENPILCYGESTAVEYDRTDIIL